MSILAEVASGQGPFLQVNPGGPPASLSKTTVRLGNDASAYQRVAGILLTEPMLVNMGTSVLDTLAVSLSFLMNLVWLRDPVKDDGKIAA